MSEPEAGGSLNALLSQGTDGIYLTVHLQPGAHRSSVGGVHGDALKVAVGAPPADGKANRAMLDFIADLLGVGNDRLELVSGHTSRRKRVLIRDAGVEEVKTKLQTALASR